MSEVKNNMWLNFWHRLYEPPFIPRNNNMGIEMHQGTPIHNVLKSVVFKFNLIL